ncbi:unnamed protein product (macronuclear) [Paramecium tetraurelia]|uniref:Cyclin N-terminal domain-containing protein n=1 Tax=Paramecium tetraurelia TaxID=5888 RepID=A0DNC7_PARTE|nr:uncharacterized protein GSPATT00018739001 [Paramecium tetraurelia]CAK84544.1 unnamed protein product [Paramecium tetraurelia]|eukprot:XP_001451941.1 hypothetical protein (macronuclear) [Paramecium tetraurelia strain d4-2]
MKGGAAVQQNSVIDKISILLNKIFAYSNLAEREGKGICPNIFTRQQDIIQKLVSLQRMGVNDEIFVTGLFLVDRLTTNNNFYLNKRNIYNLLMTAIILCLKMYDDNQNVQHIYSIIFETNREILNKMEKKFMKLIKYQLFVKTEDFFNYRARLLKLKD